MREEGLRPDSQLAVSPDRLRSVYYATRGDILYSKEDSDSAFAEYNKAIELDPENYMAMNNAAYYMAWSNISDEGSSSAFFSDSVSISP